MDPCDARRPIGRHWAILTPIDALLSAWRASSHSRILGRHVSVIDDVREGAVASVFAIGRCLNLCWSALTDCDYDRAIVAVLLMRSCFVLA